MGYDLHITRRRDWSDDGPEIAVREWLALIEADAELEPWPANGPHFALWKGAAAQDEEWLDWQEGNIYSKNPSPALIDKMVALAAQLNAKVQGDDGETYA